MLKCKQTLGWVQTSRNSGLGTCSGHGKFYNEQWALSPRNQLVSAQGSRCATVRANGVVLLAKCADPVPANQTWHYDNATQQLKAGDGMCVTAGSSPPPPPPPAPAPGPAVNCSLVCCPPHNGPHGTVAWSPCGSMVLGRPLAGGMFAVLFLNNHPSNASELVCDAACMRKLGLDNSTRYNAIDVWTRTVKYQVQGNSSSMSVVVPPRGASIYVKLVPTRSSFLSAGGGGLYFELSK